MNTTNAPHPAAVLPFDVEDFGLLAAAWFALVRKVAPRPEPAAK